MCGRSGRRRVFFTSNQRETHFRPQTTALTPPSTGRFMAKCLAPPPSSQRRYQSVETSATLCGNLEKYRFYFANDCLPVRRQRKGSRPSPQTEVSEVVKHWGGARSDPNTSSLTMSSGSGGSHVSGGLHDGWGQCVWMSSFCSLLLIGFRHVYCCSWKNNHWTLRWKRRLNN